MFASLIFGKSGRFSVEAFISAVIYTEDSIKEQYEIYCGEVL